MSALEWTGLGVGLLQSGINHVINSNNMKKQFEYQKDLMRIQNDYNVQNWHMQNSYNTPIAQMQRLKAAGLNPDLMYGNGSAGVQATLPNGVSGASAPGYSPAPEGVNLASDIQALANAKLAGAKTVGQNIENSVLREQILAGIAETYSRIGLNEENQKKVKAETANLEATLPMITEQINQIRENVTASQWHRMCERMETITKMYVAESQIELNSAQKEQLIAVTPAMVAQLYGVAGMQNALSKVAGIIGDPEKAVKLFNSWMDELGKFLSGDFVQSIVDGVKNGIKGTFDSSGLAKAWRKFKKSWNDNFGKRQSGGVR